MKQHSLAILVALLIFPFCPMKKFFKNPVTSMGGIFTILSGIAVLLDAKENIVQAIGLFSAGVAALYAQDSKNENTNPPK